MPPREERALSSRPWWSSRRREPPLATGSAASAWFQPIRRERLIAGCRLVLSSFSLLALWLDPSEPARYAALTYALVAGYVVYSAALGLWLLRARSTPPWVPLLVHGIDLGLFGVVIFVTAGPTSPFFLYFVFAVAAATVRWQERGTLATAIVALAAFLAIGLYSAARLPDAGFELNRFIIRSIYLAVVAVLLGYVGAYESRLRARAAAIGEWPAVAPGEPTDLVEALLEHAAKALAAPRTLLVWEEAEEPWTNVASWAGGELEWRREAPGLLSPLAPPELAGVPFFLRARRRADAPFRLLTAGGSRTWHGDPLPPGLRSLVGDGALLAVPVRGESLEGSLFALDRPDMTSDELVLGRILARQLAVRLDRRALFDRFHRAALTEERLRLARDLHDGVIQTLAGSALRLESARQLVGRSPATAAEVIRDIQEILVAEQRELRAFIATFEAGDAVPAAAATGGAERLDQLADRVGRHWDLRIELRNELPAGEVPPAIANDVSRLVQEALVNASRHGRAATATVEVRLEDGRLRLTVSDDGCGFPFHGRYDLAALTARRMGPVSLKQRVSALRGDLEIESSQAGARVVMTIPCAAVGEAR
jgi:signal transduction histidine kinase